LPPVTCRAALDDVAGHDPAGERVPIVACPAVVPGRGVRQTTAASVTRPVTTMSAPRLECLDDAEAPEVGVGVRKPEVSPSGWPVSKWASSMPAAFSSSSLGKRLSPLT